MRRSRTLNNIGILDMMEHRWADARSTFAQAVEFASMAGLTEHWARAALNAGVLALRTGDTESAGKWLGEALRISAEAQNTELQLGATYNLALVARDSGHYVRARNTFELATELAQRIGQSEIQVGALAGMGVCQLALGEVDDARRIHQQLQAQLAPLPEWFQGRELIEALGIRLALLDERDEAAHLFIQALDLADTRDVYGAALLTAEFGPVLREFAPEVVATAVRRYAGRPEVVENARVREQFGVLMLDSASSS